MTFEPMSKEDFESKVPLVNHEEIIDKIKKINEIAKEFNEFEGSFLKETLRQAKFFKSKYRMSAKSKSTLEHIYCEIVLGEEIDKKIKLKEDVSEIRRLRRWYKKNNYINPELMATECNLSIERVKYLCQSL